MSETTHEIAMQELAERIVEANQRDTRLAQTDPRTGRNRMNKQTETEVAR